MAREFGRRLWVRAALISALALVAPLLAPIGAAFLPNTVLTDIRTEQVRALLDILANSMLAVTTFSLTIMVTAHLAADQSASPRGHRQLRDDGRTQTVLATFVGSFVFALVSIVVLQTGIVGSNADGAYYLMTLVVFGIVIVTILRWIGQLASLGSVEATIAATDETARRALETRAATPFLGGRPMDVSDIPDNTHALLSPRGGHIQHIDTGQLSSLLEVHAGKAFITAMPGTFVCAGDTLALVTPENVTTEDLDAMSACFTLGTSRSFDQDPVYAITVLTEIAERALSPGINDPRTALDVCSRLTMILSEFEGETPVDRDQLSAPLVHAPTLDLAELVASAFEPIARDGKGLAEIQIKVQTALDHLSRHRLPEMANAARLTSARALAWSEAGLLIESDREQVATLAPADRPVATRNG